MQAVRFVTGRLSIVSRKCGLLVELHAAGDWLHAFTRETSRLGRRARTLAFAPATISLRTVDGIAAARSARIWSITGVSWTRYDGVIDLSSEQATSSPAESNQSQYNGAANGLKKESCGPSCWWRAGSRLYTITFDLLIIGADRGTLRSRERFGEGWIIRDLESRIANTIAYPWPHHVLTPMKSKC